MRKLFAGFLLALSAGVTSPVSAQSAGYVDLSFFLQTLSFANTGTTTLTQLQYSHGPIAAGSAVFDLNGNNGAAGGTASNFLSNGTHFMTVTWSGLNVGAGLTANFGSVDNDFLVSLPAGIDQQIITGGLNDSFIRAWFSNGDVLTGNLADGSWTASQRVTLERGTTNVPEPSSLLLVGAGLVGIAAVRRRRAA